MTEDEQILTSLLNCRRVDLYTEPKNLTDEESKRYLEMQERRSAGEPLQYVLGHCEFRGIKLFVDRRVLVPRPETEQLVEQCIRNVREDFGTEHVNVLDLGTGSGNIAIVLAKELENCHVTAVDISPDALEVARANAKNNGVEDKITFVCRELEAFLAGTAPGTFHAVISNPPYIPSAQLARLPKDVQQEPRIALDGGEDGLKYFRQIFTLGQPLLKPEGLIFCEIGDGQRPLLEEVFCNLNLKGFDFIKDYNKIERVVKLSVK